MYAPQPPQSRPDPAWQPAINPPANPPARGYLPEPVPPSPASPFASQAAVREIAGKWLRIPIERPIITPVLIGVLFLIYLPMAFSPDLSDKALLWGANIHQYIMEGQWYRLITATFLHASIDGIPFIHVLSNAYGLWAIGMELERLVGRARFAAIYAISGLAGSVASFAFLPLNASSVGASGAIFGLIGAMAVYFGLHRKVFGRMGSAWFWNMIIIIVLNGGIGLSGVLPVDNSAHIGGLIAGAIVGYVLSPRYALGSWYNLLVRNVENTNKGSLPWIATALLGGIVIFGFFAVLLLFQAGILHSGYITGQ